MMGVEKTEFIRCPICGNKTRDKVREDTILICIMMANNEIGNIYPIKEITLKTGEEYTINKSEKR